MKVLFEEREYRIEFNHGFTPVTFFRHKGGETISEREKTVCLIRDASSPSPGDGTAPVIAQGWVVRHYLDTPNRELARRASLAAALANLDVVLGASMFAQLRDALFGLERARSRRRAFWDAYLGRKGAATEAQYQSDKKRLHSSLQSVAQDPPPMNVAKGGE